MNGVEVSVLCVFEMGEFETMGGGDGDVSECLLR